MRQTTEFISTIEEITQDQLLKAEDLSDFSLTGPKLYQYNPLVCEDVIF